MTATARLRCKEGGKRHANKLIVLLIALLIAFLIALLIVLVLNGRPCQAEYDLSFSDWPWLAGGKK